MDVYQPPKSLPSFKHDSMFINMTFEIATAVDFGIISDQETIG